MSLLNKLELGTEMLFLGAVSLVYRHDPVFRIRDRLLRALELEDGGKRRMPSLPLTRADIANFLGLTIKAVSRQLTRLRTDKIISIEPADYCAKPSTPEDASE